MPKRTLKRNKRKKAKKHGFRERMSSFSGQKLLKRRRRKTRTRLIP